MNDKVLTTDDIELTSLQLGRRVKEILDDKGAGFTVPAFSRRIGMSESTLYRCLSGERYFKPSELDRVAEGLNITVARLKREDTKKKFIMMQAQEKQRINLPHAMELALELLPSALGCTERFEILNSLGASYFHLKKFKLARNTWSDALPLAENILENYGDYQPLYMVLSNLILANTKLKDYSTLKGIFERIDLQLQELPPRFAGTISYSQAMNAYNMDDFDLYEEKMMEQLGYFQLSHVERLVTIALHNVGYMFYKVGKYDKSRNSFEEAIEYISNHPALANSDLLYYVKKDYSKTLYRLGDRASAIKVVTETLKELAVSNLDVLRCKFLFLHSLFTDNPKGAEEILTIEQAGKQLHLVACEYLTDYYCKIGDGVALMKYYKIGDALGWSSKTTLEDSV